MKLATLKSEKRDGTLVVVDQNLKWAVSVPEIALTMQAAIHQVLQPHKRAERRDETELPVLEQWVISE